MKKLLNMLGVITLSTVVGNSVIACVQKEEPSVNKTKLSELAANINVSNVKVGNIDDFIDKLIAELQKQQSFNNLTVNDVVITKDDDHFLQDSDIVEGQLSIKINAKQSSQNFIGEKIIIVKLTVNKIPLSTITQLTGLNIIVNVNQKNRELNSQILQATQLQNYQLVNPKIKYFSDEQVKNDVTAEQQKAGDLYVVISANVNDKNYYGSTTALKITIAKNNLRTITQLTGLAIITDASKTYDELWDKILEAPEIKKIEYKSYETFMYKTADLNDQTSIKDLQQTKGTIYVVLQLQENDSETWIGQTPRLKVVLK